MGMRFRFCPECGHRIQTATPFCDDCGIDFEVFGREKPGKIDDEFKDSLKNMVEDLIENNSDILKELSEKINSGEPMDKGMFFAVEMRDGTPTFKRGNIKDLEGFLKGASINPFTEQSFEEPDGVVFKDVEPEISEYEGAKIIRIQMPGVNSAASTVIRKMPEGLEVIGRGDRTIYYSKVPAIGGCGIKNRRFEGDSFVIEVR